MYGHCGLPSSMLKENGGAASGNREAPPSVGLASAPLHSHGCGRSERLSHFPEGLGIRDPLNVYLLSRARLRQCLECSGCLHQYLWPLPPVLHDPALLLSPGSPSLLSPTSMLASDSRAMQSHDSTGVCGSPERVAPLRLHLLRPPGAEEWRRLATWRRGFTVESLLAPRDTWPQHLSSALAPHLTQHLTAHTPGTVGDCHLLRFLRLQFILPVYGGNHDYF